MPGTLVPLSHDSVPSVADPQLSHTRHARSVIGHVHWVHTACDFHANSVKAIPVMAAWHYNWTAAHAAQGEQVYLSSQDRTGKAAYPVPRVLALSPVVSLALSHVSTGLKGMQVGPLVMFRLGQSLKSTYQLASAQFLHALKHAHSDHDAVASQAGHHLGTSSSVAHRGLLSKLCHGEKF